ncbi:MAG: hypothetical protein OXG72_07805 [Acidobacteria bacterium]|nr:hypothetical protein [Acidobacteriota bacterium]
MPVGADPGWYVGYESTWGGIRGRVVSVSRGRAMIEFGVTPLHEIEAEQRRREAAA